MDILCRTVSGACNAKILKPITASLITAAADYDYRYADYDGTK